MKLVSLKQLGSKKLKKREEPRKSYKYKAKRKKKKVLQTLSFLYLFKGATVVPCIFKGEPSTLIFSLNWNLAHKIS